MMTLIRPARLSDVAELAEFLRPADKAECWNSGSRPSELIRQGIEISPWCYMAEDDHGPIAIWGVGISSLIGGVGIPWCLTTAGVESRRWLFARQSKLWVERMRDGWGMLEGWCDADYAVSLRWLQWLGFTIDEPIANYQTGHLFHRVWMTGHG